MISSKPQMAGDLFRKMRLKLNQGVWTLKPKTKARGRVLLSYTILPFTSPKLLRGHSNRWECRRISAIWTERGYEVDIVDFSNLSFRPKKDYDFCIDVESGLERLSPYLKPECIKIYHITSAHWKFQNESEAKRIADIEKRKGVKLSPRRILAPSRNIELCDIATMLGNDFTESTYSFARKRIVHIPISTTHTFPSPEAKDFGRVRKNFIWLGGAGMAHKGLDLVLEAFATLPDFNLTVFGKKDADFAEVYKKELFETPNISYKGVIDIGGPEFSRIINESVGVVFPSCSEGGGGSVIECMHAGLIPIVSREASVNVDDFGILLRENSISEIRKEVVALSSLPVDSLKERALKAWSYVRTHHTRETFSKAYEDFVDSAISGKILK